MRLSVPIVESIVVRRPRRGPSGSPAGPTRARGPPVRVDGWAPGGVLERPRPGAHPEPAKGGEDGVLAQMKSARSLRMAPLGLAPMMLFTGLPPWNTVM